MSGQEGKPEQPEGGVDRRKFLKGVGVALAGGLAIGAGAGPAKDELEKNLRFGLDPEALWQRDAGRILESYIQKGVYSSKYLEGLVYQSSSYRDRGQRRGEYFAIFSWGTYETGESVWQGELKAEKGLQLPIRMNVDYTKEGKIRLLRITANIARPDIPQFKPFIVGPEQNNLGEESLPKAAEQFFRSRARWDIRWTAGNPLVRDPKTGEFSRGEPAFARGKYNDRTEGLDIVMEVNTRGEASLEGVRSS